MAALPRLVIGSKSRWDPDIRREHALARLASRDGHHVRFIERPADVRELSRSGTWSWLRALHGQRDLVIDARIEVIRRSSLMPPHLNRAAESLDGALMRRLIPEAHGPSRPTLVATLPWQWPAVSGVRAYRRVLDVADDWAALIPARAGRVRECYARAAEEADAIIVVSEELRGMFPDREVAVVRNGVDSRLVSAPYSAPAGSRRLVYVGTLSERFDSPLVGALLDRLSGWTLALYGPCAYARRQAEPDAELASLLGRSDRRAVWHGPVPRRCLANVIDSADVLLLPNRSGHSRGQDSMKIYDYASRGRAIVATRAATAGISERPPHLHVGGDADELAALVEEARMEPLSWADQRLRWAAGQSWESRWPKWSQALFGKTPGNGIEADAPGALLPSAARESCHAPPDPGWPRSRC